jgi:hypothetical protein
MSESDDVLSEGFLVNFPLWLVVPRTEPRSPDDVPGSERIGTLPGYACAVERGVTYVPVFTDQDLANRWVKHDNRLEKALLAAIETVEPWLNTLYRMKDQDGVKYLGFDPWPDGRPVRVFTIETVIREFERQHDDRA